MSDFKINNIRLSLSRSIPLLIILFGWSIYNIMGGIFNSIYFYQYVTQGFLYYELLESLIASFSGILLLFLLIDIMRSKEFTSRHRFELVCLLLLQIIYQLARPIPMLYFNLPFLNYQPYDIANYVISISIAVFSIIFYIYIITNILYGLKLVNKRDFLIIFLIFASFSMYQGLYYVIDFTGHYFYLFQIISFGLIYLVATYFFLRVYQKFRNNELSKLVMPIYLRIALFEFGFMGLASVYLLLVSNGRILLYGGVVIGDAPNVWSFIYYLGFIVFSFFPPKISFDT
jgi:hypothetical protein